MLKTGAGQVLAATPDRTQQTPSSGAQAPRHGHHSDRTRTIRGGRITKFKGQAASFASGAGCSLWGAAVSALLARFSARAALLASVAFAAIPTIAPTPASAGSCSLDGDTFVCTGPADATQDVTQTFATSGDDIRIETDPAFGIDTSTSGGNAFTLEATGGNLVFDDGNESDITGAVDGINVNNQGDGFVQVTAHNVTGTAERGIFATSGLSGSGLSVTTTDEVFGGLEGIRAVNNGSGSTTIIANQGSVGVDTSAGGGQLIEIPSSGGSYSGSSLFTPGEYYGLAAIHAQSGENTTYTRIEAGNVTGLYRGIFADHNGQGALTITTTGDVRLDGPTTVYFDNPAFDPKSGFSQGDQAQSDDPSLPYYFPAQVGFPAGVAGIEANTGANATALTITANRIIVTDDPTSDTRFATRGGGDGILAEHRGSEDLTIRTTGEVQSSRRGIVANNFGQAAIRIIAEDTIIASGGGINASNLEEDPTYTGPSIALGTDIEITATDVTANNTAIRAENNGNGSTDITVTGDINSGLVGVLAVNAGLTTGIRLELNNVSASYRAVDARSYSVDGDVYISSTGTIDGGSSGVRALSSQSDVTLRLNEVEGEVNAVEALTDGGDVDIEIVGQVRQTGYNYIYTGVRAQVVGPGSSRIVVSSIEANGTGILSSLTGTSDTSIQTITATGTITAQTGWGVRAIQIGGTELTIETAGVTAEYHAIFAQNTSANANASGLLGGSMRITATGDLVSRTSTAVAAYNDAGQTTMDITVANVEGFIHGLDLDHLGTGALTVTANGDVRGQGGVGIFARNRYQTDTIIEVSGEVYGYTGGIVMSVGDFSSGRGSGTTYVTLNSGADVSANSRFGIAHAHLDTTTKTIVTVNEGARVAGSIELAAGDDELLFTGGDFSQTTTLNGRDGDNDLLAFRGSSGAIDTTNFLNWETVEISNGSTLSASGEQLLETQMFRVLSGGALSFADGSPAGAFTQSGDFEGGGTLVFDVDFANSAADQMRIEGDVTGVTQIGINALSTATQAGDEILLISVGGKVAQTAFALPGGIYESGAYVYELEADLGVDDTLFSLANLSDDNGDPILSSTAQLYEVGSTALLGATQLPGLAARFAGRTSDNENAQAITALGYAASPQLAEVLDGSDASGAWMQVQGDWQNLAYASTGYATEVESESFNIRFGGAFERAFESNRLVFGVQGSVLWMTSDASFAFGSGSTESNGFTLGASATWLHDTGFYADAQIEFGQLTSDFASSGFGSLATDVTSGTTALSFEVGKAFELTPNSVLIPQAQLQFGRVSTDDFTDSNSTLVSFGDDTSTTGRLGVLYQFNGSGYNLFAAANAIQDFSGRQDVEFGGLDLGIDPEATWGEVELGGSFAINERATLFGSASYRTTLGSEGDEGEGGSVAGGFSISF